jgi:hypothetical protein
MNARLALEGDNLDLLIRLFEGAIIERGFEFEGQLQTHYSASRFFQFEEDQHFVGGAWLILKSPAGFAFETWDTWKDCVPTYETDAEIALICVDRRSRGPVTFVTPFTRCLIDLSHTGISRFFAELDLPMVRFCRRYGLPFKPAHPSTLVSENGTNTMLYSLTMADLVEAKVARITQSAPTMRSNIASQTP